METTTSHEQFTSLYAHFPFCEAKCHYCDFFSLPEERVEGGERTRIYKAIHRELELFDANLRTPLKTVFLGGGTPSLVPLDVMRAFIGALKIDGSSEVTMEANPSSITVEKAKAWRAMGINRVSMGVQALENERLKWLGRVHDKKEVFESLTALFEAGFRSVSTDYIVGVPGQSLAMIRSELDELLGAFPNIRHISAYLLTLKPSNPKFKELPSDEEQLAHLRTVREVLLSHGFEQYEISNFARKDAQALHNENYWVGGSYLGIGPSAHSYWQTTRQRTKNWASLGKYCELVEAGQPGVEWSETLDQEQERLEYLMLRLRRADGVDLAEYRRLYGRDLYQDRKQWIDLWLEKGLCRLGNRLQLTADGFFLSDQILNNIS